MSRVTKLLEMSVKGKIAPEYKLVLRGVSKTGVTVLFVAEIDTALMEDITFAFINGLYMKLRGGE